MNSPDRILADRFFSKVGAIALTMIAIMAAIAIWPTDGEATAQDTEELPNPYFTFEHGDPAESAVEDGILDRSLCPCKLVAVFEAPVFNFEVADIVWDTTELGLTGAFTPTSGSERKSVDTNVRDNVGGLSTYVISVGLATGARISSTVTQTLSLEKTRFLSWSGTGTRPRTTAPDAPANLRHQNSPGTVRLIWDDPEDETILKYQVRQRIGDAAEWPDWSDISSTNYNTTSHTVSSLTDGTEYTFQVRAVGFFGDGDASEVKATPGNTPVAPSNLDAVVANQQVQLNWDDPSDTSITSYQVSIDNGVSWDDVDGSGATTTTHTLVGLTNEVEYMIQVRAVNAVGPGPGARVTATPTAKLTGPGGDFDDSGDAEHSTITVTDDFQVAAITVSVEITYSEASVDRFAQSLHVYLAPPGVDPDERQIGSATFADHVALVTGLSVVGLDDCVSGAECTFTLTFSSADHAALKEFLERDINSAGEWHIVFADDVGPDDGRLNSWSLRLLSLPAEASNLTVLPGVESVEIGWDASGDDSIDNYQYRVSSDGGDSWDPDWTDITGSDHTTTSHEITGLSPETSYTIEIRAVNPGGEGPSASATVTTLVIVVPTVESPVVWRIEPSISSVTLRGGERVKLSVDAWGVQDILDNGLIDDDEGVTVLWSDVRGGSFSAQGGRTVIYTAPSGPGTSTVTATMAHGTCLEAEVEETDADMMARCSATTEIIVRRPSAGPGESATPVNPSGPIPTVITDSAGTAYAVFTPVEGGEFSGEGFSVSAGPGAVPNGEIIGISMSEGGDASNVGATHQRYTLAGSEYDIEVVDASGAEVSAYRLDTHATVCVPLPDRLRSNISDVSLTAVNDDGTLTVLTSNVRISGQSLELCGRVSSLPATVAAGAEGAPEDFPPPPTEPEVVTPDTGGSAPSATYVLLLLIAGMAITVVAMATRRNSAARRLL